MFAPLLLLGLLGEQDSGQPPVQPGVRAQITADERRTVDFKEITSTAARGPSVATLGAELWLTHLDPHEERSYAAGFDDILPGAAELTHLERISLSASGRALGLRISTTYPPFIGTDGKTVQLRFFVIEEAQDALVFSGSGAQVEITFRAGVNTTPVDKIERTAILTLRQQ